MTSYDDTQHTQPALLLLEDGASFRGRSVGAPGEAVGEVAFTTAMTGYHELLTDPATWGQLLAFTYPLIGNCGVNDEDAESDTVHARAVIAAEIARFPSHFRAAESLPTYLRRQGVIAVEGVDTRALARHLSRTGPLKGIIATGDVDPGALRRRLQVGERNGLREGTISQPLSGALTHPVTAARPYRVGQAAGPRLNLLDVGVRRSTLRALAALGFNVNVYPAQSTPDELLADEPAGIVVAGGAGRLADAPEIVTLVKALIGRRPLLGIGAGHMFVGAALGAAATTLPAGHRGRNVPVKELESGKVYITHQHHGEALVAGSWSDPDVQVSHVHAGDGSIEGLTHDRFGVRTVQFYLEERREAVEAWYGSLLRTIAR